MSENKEIVIEELEGYVGVEDEKNWAKRYDWVSSSLQEYSADIEREGAVCSLWEVPSWEQAFLSQTSNKIAIVFGKGDTYSSAGFIQECFV